MEDTHEYDPAKRFTPPSRVSILLSWDDDVRAVALGDGQSLIVGRAEPSELLIGHPSLSRVHARISVHDGSVTVEDLGSMNGCLLNGSHITSASLREEDELRLGAVEVRLCARSIPGDGVRALCHAAFMRALQDELTRARLTGRHVSIFALKQEVRAGVHEVILAALGPLDRWCAFAPNLDLVLLAERDGDSARRWLEAIRWPSRQQRHAGLASYPQVACNAEGFVSHALHLCHSAGPGSLMEVAAQVAPVSAPANPIVISTPMVRLYELVTKAARTTLPVLIQGETGCGKELVACALHERSPRSKGPFKALSCATLPTDLLESVLFGHERGAFTGADRQTRGVFEQAEGGTVFLDEVGELSAQAQAALLRVLEQRRLVRVGGTREIEVNARVVAATHRNLSAMVQSGTFREDLMFRLDALTLRVPPLRDRPEEILPLARAFAARAREQWAASARELSADVCDALVAYKWPGNVRQLKNVVERAVVVCAGSAIELEDLPAELWLDSFGRARTSLAGDQSAPELTAASDTDGALQSLPIRVREFEATIIRDALSRTGGNQAQAARLLGVPRRTLVSKAQLLGLLGSEARHLTMLKSASNRA